MRARTMLFVSAKELNRLKHGISRPDLIDESVHVRVYLPNSMVVERVISSSVASFCVLSEGPEDGAANLERDLS